MGQYSTLSSKYRRTVLSSSPAAPDSTHSRPFLNVPWVSHGALSAQTPIHVGSHWSLGTFLATGAGILTDQTGRESTICSETRPSISTEPTLGLPEQTPGPAPGSCKNVRSCPLGFTATGLEIKAHSSPDLYDNV